MKLAVIAALALLAVSALAQTPPSRDPVRDRMREFATACLDREPPSVDRDPARFEANASKCETALTGLDGYFASVADPTPRQRAYHALQRFNIQRSMGSAYNLADMSADLAAGRRFEQAPGARTCAAYEGALKSHNSIDPSALGSSMPSESALRIMVRDLERCRKRDGAPDGAAPLPVLAPEPPRAPPPPGTLAGDGSAYLSPCMAQLADEQIPPARRIETCERAATFIPTIRAVYPDAPDTDVFVFENQAMNMLIALGTLEQRLDGRDQTRACATFAAAETAAARLRGLQGYASMTRPFENFVASASESCSGQGQARPF